MPAETHSHSEPVTADDILDLLATIVRGDVVRAANEAEAMS